MSDSIARAHAADGFAPENRDTVRLRWRRFRRHGGAVAGAVIVGAIVLLAVLAPVIVPHDPFDQDLSRRLINPIWHDNGQWAHPLGTDALGRDYLSRLIYGARTSVLVGVLASLMSGVLGTVLGVAAGYFGGRVDLVVMFLVTTRLATPVFLIGLTAVAVIGGSLQVVVCVLGLVLWDRFVVVTRSATQQLRSSDFIAAAQCIGCSRSWILFREVLPNILGALIVVATLEMAHAILIEAALSFLGLGVQPPLPSWGMMVSEGKQYMFFSPWIVTIPGLAIFALVLGINLLGDGIRDLAAPENRT